MSRADGSVLVEVQWRDQPTQEQIEDGVLCVYGFLDRMAVAAWIEAALEESLKKRVER